MKAKEKINSYLFNYNNEIDVKINFILAKRALINGKKPEKLCDLFRNLVNSEYEKLKK